MRKYFHITFLPISQQSRSALRRSRPEGNLALANEALRARPPSEAVVPQALRQRRAPARRAAELGALPSSLRAGTFGPRRSHLSLNDIWGVVRNGCCIILLNIMNIEYHRLLL